MSEFTDWLVIWPLLLPAIAAACSVAAWGHGRTQRILVLLGAASQCVSSIVLVAQVYSHGPVSMDVGGWPAPFGVSFAATQFGAVLTVVASATALSILVYGFSLAPNDRRHAGFAPLLLVLLTGVAGAFLTADIFNLYVWFEVTLITALGLLVVGGTSEQLGGALKYALPNLFATTLLLIATALLYGMTGTLNMPDIAAKVAQLPNSPALQTVAMMFLLALGMKSALFPLAFWLPASYHTAGPTVAAVFGALLTKVGVYAMIQVFLTLFASQSLLARDVMEIAAALTVVIGSIGMLAETDIRRWVSFSVLSSVGFMVIGIAIGNPRALAGSIAYVVHSIILSAALFMASGLIVRRGSGLRLSELRGLGAREPVLSAVFLALGLSLAGVPPFTGFWPKVLLIQGSLELGDYWTVAAIAVSGFTTLFVVGRTFALIFWRRDKAEEDDGPAPNEHRSARWALAGLALTSLILGIAPAPLLSFASRSANALLGGAP
ncbi:MAG: proton-conducting transporter membrane subunit [Myxococcota bacterium]